MGTFGNRSKNLLLVLAPAGVVSVGLLVGDSLAQTPPLCQQVKYLLSNGNAHDVAGTTVDLNSDFMFVGRPTTGSMLTDPISSVYIFKSGQTPGSWIEYQVILDPREDNTESLFGQRLSVDEDSLIVTMVREESPSGVIGAAAIFRLDVATDTWILEQKLFPFNGSPSRSDVAIDGDFAIIGQRHNNHGGVRAGAAFVFRFDGSSWNEEAEFFTIDRSLDDLFGSSVAMFGNIVIVGAPQEDDLGVDSGSVHVYKRINGSWFDVGKINAPDGAAGDLFGGSVDYDGTTLAIGASGHESGGPDSGAVYLYRDNGLPGWEFITKLAPPPAEDSRNNGFGVAVDIDDDRLFIGSFAFGSDGSAHVYRNTGAGWEHVLRLVAQDFFSERFGIAVAIHNENVVIGAPHDTEIGINAGAVYTHTNIFIPDCNENCISDTEEIAAGTAFDCNLNGILDQCDLTDGVTLDCNNNGIPDECEDCDNNGIADECELAGQYTVDSPQLSPIGLGFPVSHTFTTPPEAQGDVTLNFAAIADLDSVFLTLDVYLNDVFQGSIFSLTGSLCPATPDEDQLVVAQADFNTLVGSGDATIRIETNDSVVFDACAGTSWVSVALDYLAPPTVPDVNGNGVPDSCDLARGDSNLDGFVNVTDLLSLLGAWGLCPGCVQDTNGDGSVNVTDLLTLLANWG